MRALNLGLLFFSITLVSNFSDSKAGFSKNLNSLNTIGYKEVIKYLEGELDYDTMVHKIKVNTRNYARRQIIYFRRFEDALWLNLSEISEDYAIREIILKIKQQK
jgi:tRNA dimethylallyltransferase